MSVSAKKNQRVRKLVYAAVCLALCLVLPFLTGQIPEIGNMLCPMHLPVLLAGFLCGPWWALAVGILAPLLRHLLFGMPQLPTAIAMCFELMGYGVVSGLLYRLLPKKVWSIYLSLVAAMIGGRILWGLARLALTGAAAEPFTWAAFVAGAVTMAIPGIILQLILIPVLVLALRKVNIVR